MIPKDLIKKRFMDTVKSFLNLPYKWGGDDPMSGFDCSGLVVEGLKVIGELKEKDDATADMLWNHYRHLETYAPTEGTFLFYFNSKGNAFHVVVCLDPYFQIGSSGGGSRTTSAGAASNQNAYVKIRPIGKITQRMKLVYIF